MAKHIVIDARIRRTSTGRYADRLLEHLQTIDHENRYSILVHADDPWRPSAANFSRVHCRYPQFSLNPLHDLGFARQMYGLKADLVHFTMTQQPVFYFGNIVTTTHDLTMLRFVRAGSTPLPIFWIKRLGYRFLFWEAHKKSRRIIVPTKFVREDLAKLQPFTATKSVVTYEASEPPLEVEAEQPSFAKNGKWKMENGKFLLYVGSAFPHKNLEKLVKAFEVLKKSHPKLHLVLVGKKEQYYKELERLAQYSPAHESIIFTGFVPDEQLKWLYKHAEAYIFPSLSEGFGLPGLEAMVHGCPVISSNATCLPEIYDEAAVYFDPNSAKNMAEAIDSVLIDGQLRDRLIVKGYAQAKKYSWHTMAEQTLAVYEKALAE
jgi:glycosyltransferase involved in cell wall biosynthesis